MKNPEKQLTIDEFRSRARQLGLQIPEKRDRELYDGFAYVEAFTHRVRKALGPAHEPAHVFMVHAAGL